MTCRLCNDPDARIHARGLCGGCYFKVRDHPEDFPGWRERFPRARRAPSPVRVPYEPLSAVVAARGGFSGLAAHVGLTSGSNERERLSLALRRGRRRGWFTLDVADDIAVSLLGLTVDEIYGYEVEAA